MFINPDIVVLAVCVHVCMHMHVYVNIIYSVYMYVWILAIELFLPLYTSLLCTQVWPQSCDPIALAFPSMHPSTQLQYSLSQACTPAHSYSAFVAGVDFCLLMIPLGISLILASWDSTLKQQWDSSIHLAEWWKHKMQTTPDTGENAVKPELLIYCGCEGI